MTEEKQSNPEGKQAFYGAGKKTNRDILKWVIFGLAGFLVIVLIFSAGMVVGGMKARFSYRWAESYHKNFAGPRTGFFGDWRELPLSPGDFIEGHGAFGEIIELNDTGFVIKGRGDVEKIIIISEKTTVKKGRETVERTDLKVGDRVVVIGFPNEEGQIEARLIRLFNGEDVKNLPRSPRFPFL